MCDLQTQHNTDDTNFFSSGKDLKTLAKSIENEMVKLKKWVNENKLSLNLCKTKFMFSAEQRKEEKVSLSIDGVEIVKVSELHFLGDYGS